jgi:hypothetical protein
MVDRNLTPQDAGADVAAAQALLNRSGALLDTDGKFGAATGAAVREFRQAAGLPDGVVVDSGCWLQLRALPEPSPDVPTRAVTFICLEEVSSRAFYDQQCAAPTWPGLASGVTIGVGYDLGQQDHFENDWRDLLPPEQIARLREWVGRKGARAAPGPQQLAGISIPWSAAWRCFIQRTLPNQVDDTRAAFGRPPALPALCFGALVSLVYNRGRAMRDPSAAPGSRKEMRAIRDAVRMNDFAPIPGLLRSMKRLWPVGSGLRGRREREARLFEDGLA